MNDVTGDVYFIAGGTGGIGPSYNYLVVALGGVTSCFGHPEWAEFAPGLKSLDDALRIRQNILV
jgi:NADH dehydrogenase FAD-containing subunit